MAAALGEVNPATGELYQEGELNIIDFNELGTAMLQDHIVVGAETGWRRTGNQETLAVASAHRQRLRGWIHCRDHAEDCVRILRELDPALGESHQQWQMNEVNKLIWPSPAGIGVMDEDRFGTRLSSGCLPFRLSLMSLRTARTGMIWSCRRLNRWKLRD